MNLYELPIHNLHQKRLSGEVTTVEIVQSILKRLENVEEKLHSFITLSEDRHLDLAEKIDHKISQKELIHSLEGMPIAIKDIFSTKGIRTTCASRFLENYVPPFESTATEKLKEAGSLLVGKTNMDEFAMGSSTENSAFGVTRNPWNVDRVPGGSSGGSASAVSSGQSLAALGTDTGGSIRQPASFTGIVGLKPTYGRVSRWGMVAFASSFDQAGPMTRDVEDAAILLQTIAGYDSRDATSLEVDIPDYSQFLNQSIKGMKIGVIKELDLSSCDSEVVRIFQHNIEVLKDAGAEIVEISMPNISDAVATYYVIAPCEASSNLGRYDGVRYGQRAKEISGLLDMYEKSRDEGFGKEVKMRILIGTFALSAGYYDAYYLKAQKVQNLIRSQYHQAFQAVDAIATPVAPTAAYKIGEMINDPLKMYLGDAFTIPANLAGIPGISVPGGFTNNNLPVGFQLLTSHLEEGKLLKIAHCFQQSLQLTKPKMSI
ncbi:MAG: Asp-tRNA(Asn)/Glu-tRNA(Gln) amidotransferase subunit GatA [Deltaproteobacteria bacterium]|nr:Asp-tRNA(Asn)/Glu-tRNA(Gln) amidotransferase subunit GatA [Deltaproteobacteria bacterium]MBT4090655.1 Asp-tRNA(Asn)/Glu-tRNA(Gln) amidotransferase subunit GatA [Deltaproteobacteria bacterium]MBT4268114.1 Asp-tRNA(Asn)/Glu-tRNA(Gln) amidotransferase subunit GatA [Deltaproteobacteria bacterium]MBT4640257.1 Asp-tRNA(Asn)/Glu-tRNA(Gln) amidotransferase subunit GatA [Deltaproteobacteria bacterium]MBT6613994.1 Asp-tRNA(Asn)/Glu-tRNA(Gln) amidotransferase subunit GatA [Deltaproteobacteria bacterium